MSDIGKSQFDGNEILPLNSLPRTTLQSLYHVVTGKTENIFKFFSKNVIIKFNDIQQLHYRISQQIEHYKLLASPTITVNIKQANGNSIQYSSFDRFVSLQAAGAEITSEVLLKYEFIIELPNTLAPQRCVINVVLDSGLPVVSDSNRSLDDSPFLDFILLSRDYRTADVSIDFFDYLVAKAFMNAVEDWFNTLDIMPKPKLTNFLSRNMRVISSIFVQVGRAGFACYLATYVWFNKGIIWPFGRFVYAICLAIMIRCFFSIIYENLMRVVSRRLIKNSMPSIILLTDGDTRAFEKIKAAQNSSVHTVFGIIFASLFTILLNIISSYIFDFL